MPIGAADLTDDLPLALHLADAADAVTHVHLTGGQAAFDALVWGGPGPRPPAA